MREPSARCLALTPRKRTELGDLPIDWQVTRLSEIATVTSGKRLPVGQSLTTSETPHPYIRVSDMRHGTVDSTAIQFVPVDVFPKIQQYRIFSTDLYISVAGTLGLVGQIPSALDGANLTENANRISGIRDSKSYLYQVLASPLVQSVIESERTVGAQPKLALGRIRNFYIPLPPSSEEQFAIGKALADADALIDSLEQLLTKKRQIKQGAMQELLTGKRRLPGFNAPWIPRSMADLFEFSGGLSASRDQLGDIGPCYLHYGDIHLSHKTYIDLDAEHHQMPRLDVDLRTVSSSALLRNGDVVFVDASEDDQGVSKHVVIHSRDGQPLISGLHTIVARPKSDELVDLYKRYCFQAPPVQAQFRFYAVGTKVSGVSKGNIGKIMLNVPSPAEQKEIAACLAEMDAEIYALESRLTKARALKQAMAQSLLTGRIRLVEPTA